MNVLFISMISFADNTSATIQNKGIIKGLHELGYKVDSLTLKPIRYSTSFDESMHDMKEYIENEYFVGYSYLYSKLMNKRKIESDGSQTRARVISKINYVLRKWLKNASNRLFIFDIMKLNVSCFKKIKLNLNIYDYVITSSDPKSSHLIGKALLKNRDKKSPRWIQYWGDPLFHDISRKRNMIESRVRNVESRIIKNADRIIYASPLTLSIQKHTFPKYASKMEYANQCTLIHQESSMKIIKDNPVVGYFGAYSSNIRDILPLYNSVIGLKVTLHIVGKSDVYLKSLDNVIIEKHVTNEVIMKYEDECDILVCLTNKRGTQIPGKLYYLSGYKKPIIVILDGDYKQNLYLFLNEMERYIFCDNNELSIKKAIQVAQEQLNNPSELYNLNVRLTSEYLAKKIINFKENQEGDC